jgi:SAM-dependent methyltransferase
VDLVERAGAVRRHPWELVRADLVGRVLRDGGAHVQGRAILDVGAGDAFVASRLRAADPTPARVVCWDIGYTDAVMAELARAAPGVEFTATRPAERFDLLLLLDVLEHVDDDATFLREVVAGNLSADGLALVVVPAWPSLFSSHDVRLLHRRRYTARSGAALLRGAGLDVVRSGGLFHSLVPVRALEKLIDRKHRAVYHHAGEWHARGALSRAVQAALRLDASLGLAASRLRVDVPGLSWWALCRRPS